MAKKYIDADLLREGLKELEAMVHSDQLVGQSMHPYDGGQLHAIKIVKELINSLQQEQPCDTCTNDKGCVTCKDGELWEGKEQPSEDLTTEIEKYFQGLWPGMETADQCNTDMHFTPPAIMRLARHFANWQKEQKPKWKKNGGLLRFAILEDENGRYVQHEGYKIYFNDLLKLPKED